MIRKYLLIGAVVLSGVAIPISTALQNVGAFLLIVTFTLFFRLSTLGSFWHLPFPVTGLLLGLALAIGTLWTSAGFSEALVFFWKLHAYYFIPIFFAFFSQVKYRNMFLISFIAGVFVSVLLSCVSAWFNYPIFKAVPGDWFIFRTHTYQNYFSAIVGVGLLSILLTKKMPVKWMLTLLSSLMLISYNILFLVAGRTGQIIYVGMFFLVLFLWHWKRGAIASVIIAALLAIVLPVYSPAYNTGLSNAQSDLNSFSKGNAYTSVGLRLTWHQNSVKLIKEKPFFGHGTGSFKNEYERISGSKGTSLTTENPHNDYLWLSVDLGVFGGLLLLGLLISAAWQGRYLLPTWRFTLYALLLGMGISTLANSFFTDNITGLAFVLLTSALLNGPTTEKETYD